MKDSMPDARETLLVGVTLLGQTGRGLGARPSAREIREYADGALTAERRAEIESHLAHDPDVFRSFLLSARVRKVRPVRNSSWRDRLPNRWALAGVGACALAVVGVALTLGLLRGHGSSTAASQSVARHVPPAKAPATPVRDWRRRAFVYGFENPGTWDRVTGEGLDSLGGACRGERCVSELDAMTDFGVAVAQISERCRESADTTTPLQGADGAVARLQSLRGKVTDPTWSGALERLVGASGGSAGRFCGAAGQIARTAKVSR